MIYIIEKAWIDPLENINADGYSVHGYVKTEAKAKKIVESGGFFTKADCWSINEPMPKYRYYKLEELC